MRQHRKQSRNFGLTLAAALLALPALACGPTIFADTDALTIVGDPPPLPPPPEPEPEPEPPPQPKRVEILPADDHGTDLLEGSQSGILQTKILDYLQVYAPA